MKNIYSLLILNALLILTTSCKKNRIFSENKNIPNHHWEKEQSIDFYPEISDDSSSYNIFLSIRHVYGLQLIKRLKIKIRMVCPSGNILKKTFIIPFVDEKNHILSDCSGDYCDLETLIEKDFKFTEKGKYEFKVLQDMDLKSIPNLMEVGLLIDKN
jgi:gliding motility-associated lipoprotein GldH